MAMIARLGVVLGINTAEFVTGMAKADSALGKFGKSIGSMKGPLIAAGLALAAVGLKALSYADSVVDVATANDMAVDTIIKLQNALANNGGEAENASKIMSAFTKSVESAADGSVTAQKSFAQAGISLDDLAKLSAEDLFKKTIEGLDKIPDTITRNAKGFEILGKSIKNVDLKGLNQGMKDSEGIAVDQAKAMSDAADSWDLLEQAGRKVNELVAIEIGPTIKSFIDYLNADGQAALIEFANIVGASFKAIVVSVTTSVYALKMSMYGLVAIISEFPGIGFLGLIEGEIAGREKTYADQLLETMDLVKGLEKQKKLIDAIYGDPQKNPNAPDVKNPLNKDGQKPARPVTDTIGNELSKLKAEYDVIKKQYDIEIERNDLLSMRSELSTKEYNKTLEELDLQEAISNIEKKRTNDLASNKDRVKEIDKQINDQAEASYVLAVAQSQGRLRAISETNKYELNEQAKLSQVAIDRSAQLFNLQNAGRLLRVEDLQLQKDIFQIQSDLGDEIRRIDKLQLDDADAQIAKAKELADIKTAEANRQHAVTTRGGTPGEGFTDAMTKAINDLPTAMQNGAAMFESMMGNMSKSLTDFVMTGKSSFKDFAKSIIADIMAIYIRSQILTMLKGVFSMFGGPAPQVMGSMPSVPGLAAAGGYINSPTIVGENGPELFIPKTAGTVVPNQQMSGMGGSPQVVYNGPYIANMSAIDTQSATQFLAKNNKSVWAANAYANKSLAVTGGRT
jgi:lambda family phage tail tape measure protein